MVAVERGAVCGGRQEPKAIDFRHGEVFFGACLPNPLSPALIYSILKSCDRDGHVGGSSARNGGSCSPCGQP